jgi:D-glycero-D-manno-heptose 1,7-bisphosphate phosphatase
MSGGNMRQRRFVVLDRDGTVIVERHYLSDPDQVELIPGVAEALRQLHELDFGLVVLTNQSGVGRGLFNAQRVEEIHQRMRALLAAEGVQLDGVFFCPHAPEEGCRCRKPAPELIEQAAKQLGFDPRRSMVIGDKGCDIELGKRVGATTVLVRTGYGAQMETAWGRLADHTVDNVAAAIPFVQQWLARPWLRQNAS